MSHWCTINATAVVDVNVLDRIHILQGVVVIIVDLIEANPCVYMREHTLDCVLYVINYKSVDEHNIKCLSP